MKKIISMILVLLLAIGSGSMVFAEETYTIKDMNSFKKELLLLPSETSENFEIEVEQLRKNTDPKILEQFIKEKFKLAQEKTKNISEGYIDLGDNCYINVTTNTTEKNMTIKTTTPGAETVWQKYGDHKFKAVFFVSFVVAAYELNLENEYTLSKDGIEITDVSSWIDHSGLGGASSKSPKITKKDAKEGETVESNCLFEMVVGWDPVDFNRNFRMYNKIKCSEIDEQESEVKVVKQWNGEWL